MIDENNSTIFYQSGDKSRGLENTFLMNTGVLKKAVVTDTVLKGVHCYKLSAYGNGYSKLEMYFTVLGLEPIKMVTEAPPQFASTEKGNTIIFPRAEIDITYYNYSKNELISPNNINEVILIQEENISLTTKYHSYELYKL